LDTIVDIARECEGVFGARMTGGGFGGCAIILARADRQDSISSAVQEGFASRFDRRCPIFTTGAAGGAGALA
ncbi:MAG: galactokinase, partial [Planctomycetes bacterium]|nr:galactokinase [Planctomycetota bacterium]